MREKAGEITENDFDLVSNILQNTVGVITSSIEPISGLGMSNAVTLATTDQGNFIVRTNVESHLFRFEREAWIFQQLKNSEVLTPEILACGIMHSHSFSIARYIESSSPITGNIDQLRIWRTLGQYAAQLNKIKVPPSELAKTIFPMSWEEQLSTDIEIIFREDFWVKQGVLNLNEQELIKQYLLKSSAADVFMGVCQFDMSPANAVIQNSDYDQIYLLDLEWANIAPAPFYQLGCIVAEKGLRSPETKAFFEGYGFDIASENEEVERFTLHRVMRATGWARDRCPELVQENVQRSMPIIKNLLTQFQLGY